MRFSLSEDQVALRDAMRGFLMRHAAMAEVRAVAEAPHGYDARLWARMVGELGLTAIGVPEEYGGAGENFVDLALVMEELGRALTPSPFLSSVLATRILLASGDDDACGTWLTAIVRGEVVATVALLERSGDWSFPELSTTARRQGDRWLLDGEKNFVTDGLEAGLLLVLARSEEGPTLFAVRRTEEVGGVSLDALDATRPLSRVTFSAASGEIVGEAGGAVAVLERALAAAAIAIACEQVGGAARCLEMAVEYAGARVQFDRPIGSFQAIKHMLADRLLDNRSASAAAYYAAWAVDHLPDELPALASLCKAFASDAYFDAATTNIQVHGGIGFTWEHDAHLYLRRAIGSKAFLGSPQAHRERIAAHVLEESRGSRR